MNDYRVIFLNNHIHNYFEPTFKRLEKLFVDEQNDNIRTLFNNNFKYNIRDKLRKLEKSIGYNIIQYLKSSKGLSEKETILLGLLEEKESFDYFSFLKETITDRFETNGLIERLMELEKKL